MQHPPQYYIRSFENNSIGQASAMTLASAIEIALQKFYDGNHSRIQRVEIIDIRTFKIIKTYIWNHDKVEELC